jgi:site-specific recombinase XerD
MEKYKTQKDSSLIRQACEKIEGFPAFINRFKQKVFLKGNSNSTYQNYSRYLALISLHFNRLPTTLTQVEIDDYLYMTLQQFHTPSETYFKHTVFSLRFAFKIEGNDQIRILLPSIKSPKKLPVVLSKIEVTNMLNRPRQFKHRILIALLYGCGLRCFEIRNIKISDIDFHRSVLHVRQGKGKKDRYLPLGNFLNENLKYYIQLYKPRTWLFNGSTSKNASEFDRKYSQRGIQWAIHEAVKLSGIKKEVSVHTLRHSFATHLLEDGLDILSIKELLGHARIENTLVYLHVAQIDKKNKCSPIDNLKGVNITMGLQCSMDFGLDD